MTLDVPQTVHLCAAVLHHLCPPHVPLLHHHHHLHLHLLFQDQWVLPDPLVCQEGRVCQDLEDQMDAWVQLDLSDQQVHQDLLDHQDFQHLLLHHARQFVNNGHTSSTHLHQHPHHLHHHAHLLAHRHVVHHHLHHAVVSTINAVTS